MELPALFDLSESRGLCFLYDNEDDRGNVNSCLERLVWRVALTVPSNLCDIILYNGGNPGDAFNTHIRINRYLFGERKEKVYFDGKKEEFRALLNEVYASIVDRMSTIKCAGKNDLRELNEYLGRDARLKYQFIFITDFPHHMNEEQAQRLAQITAAGCKAGIFVLMSWDMNADFEDAGQSSAPFNAQQILANMEIIFAKDGHHYFKNSGHDEVFNRFEYVIDNAQLTSTEHEACLQQIDINVETAKKLAKPTILRQDFDSLEEQEYEPVINEINVTVGLDIHDKHAVTFRFNSKDYIHGFILGQSGSGKSVLLNNIITSAILKYSPQDLMLYLMDFKGVEFNRYKGEKHTKAVLVDNSDPQMTLEVLRELKEENKRRVKLWQKENVSNIDGYNSKYPRNRLPQILFVADECQVMFKESVGGSEMVIQREISEILNIIATQGRSQGIHMLLATQQLDETNISGQIMKNLTECFLLMSAPSDSDRLVPDSSDLTSKQMTGLACYYHKRELQSQVQTFFATNEELESAISAAQTKAGTMPGNGEHYCCGSNTLYFDANEKERILSIDSRYPLAAIGHNLSLEDKCLAIPLRKDFSENILFFGANKQEQTIGVMLNAMISLMISCKELGLQYNFKVINCLSASDAAYLKVLHTLQEDGLCEVVERTDSCELLRHLSNDINHNCASPTILTIIGSEHFAEMKRNSKLIRSDSATISSNNGFDISSGIVNMDFFCDDNGDTTGFEQQIEAEKDKYTINSNDDGEDDVVKTYPEALKYILDEGPMQDVHILLQVDQPANILFDDYPTEIAAMFRHKVILRSENKYLTPLRFSVDIDVETLGDDEERLRAYYYPEDGGPQLFTPYLMPKLNLIEY